MCVLIAHPTRRQYCVASMLLHPTGHRDESPDQSSPPRFKRRAVESLMGARGTNSNRRDSCHPHTRLGFHHQLPKLILLYAAVPPNWSSSRLVQSSPATPRGAACLTCHAPESPSTRHVARLCRPSSTFLLSSRNLFLDLTHPSLSNADIVFFDNPPWPTTYLWS